MFIHKTQILTRDILPWNFSDTNVDVVGMCQEKQFLVVGERSGSLHLIHIPSKQTLLTKVQKLFYLNLLRRFCSQTSLRFLKSFFQIPKHEHPCLLTRYSNQTGERATSVPMSNEGKIYLGLACTNKNQIFMKEKSLKCELIINISILFS